MLQIGADVRFITTARIKLKALQVEFKVECLLLDNDKLQQLRDDQAAGKITPAQFIKTWLVGWPEGEVADKDGKAVAFSDQAVDDLLKRVPGAPIAWVEAFYDG
jgi:hypothetical protein